MPNSINNLDNQKFKNILFKVFILLLFFVPFTLRVIKWNHLDVFHGDEGVQLIVAEHLIKYGDFIEAGEISALDRENQFILHNSPIGLYFLSLTYILGFMTLRGYLFIFVVINIFQAYLLYKSSNNLFSNKAAFITLIFALFTPLMLRFSTWPSQPVNAMFFDTLAIYFFSNFIKMKKSVSLLVAALLTFLATQMYPPMYLLIPIKLTLLIWLFWKKKNRYLIPYFMIGVIIIYIPIFRMELHHDWNNVKTLQKYFQTYKPSEENSLSFSNRLEANFSFIVSITTNADNPMVRSLFLILIAQAVILSWKSRNTKFGFLTFLILLPIIILSIFLRDYGHGDRAYLTILLPYIFLWTGEAISIILRKRMYLLVFSVCILVYFLFKDYNAIKAAKIHRLQSTEETVNFIMSTASNYKVESRDIGLFVISKTDNWDWEGSFYWYLLEKKLNQKLVSIKYASSKAERINAAMDPRYTFLICKNILEKDIETSCLGNFQGKIYSIYSHNYNVIAQAQFTRDTVYVLEKE